MAEASAAPQEGFADKGVAHHYPIAPLIRLTLISLYLALVLPLPVLAPLALRPWLLGALPLGFTLVVALLSEQVVLDRSGIQVGHPPWCTWLLRRGWSLNWPEITGLVPVRTSQNGTVYYVKTGSRFAFLLPQRVARFDDFLMRFEGFSGFRTTTIRRLTPAWTYWILAGLSGLLLSGELAALAWALASP